MPTATARMKDCRSY